MITFSDYSTAVLARSLARPRTIEGYSTLLSHVMPTLGARRVNSIRREHVLEALADVRQRGLAPKTVANVLQVIRLVLREAGSAAAAGIRVPVPDSDVRPLTQEEAGRLRQACSTGSPLDDVVLALLGSGLRLSELERLRAQDWDAEKGVARVACQADGATKSGRRRLVDVATYAQAAVARVIGRERAARSSLRRHLERRCAQAGVPRIRVHDLRHTRVTLLLLAGAPVLYVCGQAGHHDPAYTMRVYGHLVVATEEQRRTWADAA